MTSLADFEQLVRTRRATRHFKSEPVPDELLRRVLDAARWAPSGYNLQPTHIVAVRDEALRRALCVPCMSQSQILEAPVVLVFVGDQRVKAHNFENVLRMELAAEHINADYEGKLRRVVPIAFDRGPLGLGWLWKATIAPLLRLFVPVPSLPAVERSYWLAKQVMLPAMVTMLAATSAGLATVPMEGFDAGRVRRVLRLPRWAEVVLVMPLGYAADGNLSKTRLPLDEMVHFDRW